MVFNKEPVECWSESESAGRSILKDHLEVLPELLPSSEICRVQQLGFLAETYSL